MLFGGAKNAPRKEEKKEKKSEKDDKYDIQENVFTRWTNAILGEDTINNELKDFTDVRFLGRFFHLITGTTAEFTGYRHQDLNNIINTLFPDKDEKIHQLTVAEIIDANPKAVLTMVWRFMELFWKRFSPEGARDKKLTEAIKEWCLEAMETEDINLSDFTSSWRDGMALNLLPNIVDMEKIRKVKAEERLDMALSIAKHHFKVPKLLHPKDFASEHLDMKSVVCYLMTLYLSLVRYSGASPIATSSGSISGRTGSIVGPSMTPSTSTMTTVIQNDPITMDIPHESGSQETEPRSRKSSSSSQKSSRGKKTRKVEEMLREYELCLEQVLTWLLETEEEIRTMPPVEAKNLEALKRQFKDHEEFMVSLTESQESVGRVLHRGQQISQKVDEAQSNSILGQLLVVNQRWEHVKNQSMQRQIELQSQLKILQDDQLAQIVEWLNAVEEVVNSADNLADNAKKCAKQLEEHTQLQEEIHKQQATMQKLTTFVAIVEDGSKDKKKEYTDLEALLHSIGQRWTIICEWAEQRASQLDGLQQLLEQYETTYDTLSGWLEQRENDLQLLRSAHHLETEEEVMEQMRLLHQMETVLEEEHSDFIRLSQLCNELVQRFELPNGLAANKKRNELDIITQKWDNIVARLEEHSQMLVRTGKAKLSDMERAEISNTASGIPKDEQIGDQDPLHSIQSHPTQLGEPEKLVIPEEDEEKDDSEAKDTVGELPQQLSPKSPKGSTMERPFSPTKKEDEEITPPIEKFLKTVHKLEGEIRPLGVWSKNFSSLSLPQNQKIFELQTKLQDIKRIELNVTNLQFQMENIHRNCTNTKHLHIVNEAFDHFMQGWAAIVAAISEALNSLSQTASSKSESDEETASKISARLREWIRSANKILNDAHLEKISKSELTKRLQQINEQVVVHKNNIGFLRKTQPNNDEFVILEEQLCELIERIRSFGRTREGSTDETAAAKIAKLEEPTNVEEKKPMETPGNDDWLHHMEAELKSGEIAPGDLRLLNDELQRCDSLLREMHTEKQKIVGTQGDTESIEKLIKSAEAKHNNVIDSINKTQLAIHKYRRAQELAMSYKDALEDMKNTENEDINSIQNQAKDLRDEIMATSVVKREAINLMEDLATIATKSEHSRKEQIVAEMREKITKVENQWRGLNEEIDEFLSVLQKEQKKQLENLMLKQTSLNDVLQKAIVASSEATDIDELKEHADNVEKLADQISTETVELSYPNLDDANLNRQLENLKRNRATLLETAYTRVKNIMDIVGKMKEFDLNMEKINHFTENVKKITEADEFAKINELEISDSYKLAYQMGQLQNELDKDYSKNDEIFKETKKFIDHCKGIYTPDERLDLSYKQAAQSMIETKNCLTILKEKFQLIDRLKETAKKFEILLAKCEKTNKDQFFEVFKEFSELEYSSSEAEATKDSLIRTGTVTDKQALELLKHLDDAQNMQNKVKKKIEALIEEMNQKIAPPEDARKSSISEADQLPKQSLRMPTSSTDELSIPLIMYAASGTDPERTSISSGTGLSLTVDYPKENIREPQVPIIEIRGVDGQPTTEDPDDVPPLWHPEMEFSGIAPDVTDLDRLYELIEEIEEYLANLDSGNFLENIFDTIQSLKKYYTHLDQSKNTIEAVQMNMDISESEHALSRIQATKSRLDQYIQQLTALQSTMEALKQLYIEAEELVASLGIQAANVKQEFEMAKMDGSISMHLDELDGSLRQVEDNLTRTAIHLHQCDAHTRALAGFMADEPAYKDELDPKLKRVFAEFQKIENELKQCRLEVDKRITDHSRLNHQIELLEFWCDETEMLEEDPIGLTQDEISTQRNQITKKLHEMNEKANNFKTLEDLKNRFLDMPNVEKMEKHTVRRQVTQLGKRLSDVKIMLHQKNILLEKCQNYLEKIHEIEDWLLEAERKLTATKDAKIYTPALENILDLRDTSDKYHETTNDLAKEISENFETMEEKPLEPIMEKLRDISERINNMARDLDEIIENYSETGRSDDDEDIHMINFSKEDAPNFEELKPALSTPPQEPQSLTTSIQYAPTLEDSDIHITPKHSHEPTLSIRDKGILDAINHSQNWLHEIERDAGFTVDIIDSQAIRNLGNKMQNAIDELKVQKLEMLKLYDESRDDIVRKKAEEGHQHMEKVLGLCQRRKIGLNKMADDARGFEELNDSLDLWLNDANETIIGDQKVNDLNEKALEHELKVVESLLEECGSVKERMKELNAKSDELLNAYRHDDCHNLMHVMSKINTEWSKFNDAIRIRRAVLDASLRSRNDFHSALSHFEQWLDTENEILKKLEYETANAQLLKDTEKRLEWVNREKDTQNEIEAHREVLDSIRQMGTKLLDNLQEGSERAQLGQRLDQVEQDWRRLNGASKTVKNRLNKAQNECESLTRSLAELSYWADLQLKNLFKEQPVRGDILGVQKQLENGNNLKSAIDGKEKEVNETLELGTKYLMQNNLRRDFTDGGKDELSHEKNRLGLQISADSERLKKSWAALRTSSESWLKVVSDAFNEMQELDKALAEALLRIGYIENEIEQRPKVEEIQLENLKESRIDNMKLCRHVQEVQLKVDDVNDCAGRIQVQNIVLSGHLDAQVHAINQRYLKIKRDVAIRGTALEHAFNDFGPSSEHFLAESVKSPWQRAISSPHQLPYYIDHNTEHTQWDHPAMVDILEQLCAFNQIKFCAYRTAMKLRALQKRLCLDLVELQDLDYGFKRLSELKLDEPIKIEDMISCLVPVFEMANERFPHLVKSVPLAVDLAVNFILNVYDPCRDAVTRVLSFKVLLVVLSHAVLEDKYKYLFHLISDNDGVDHKKLALLFYDLIHVPKSLGEAAAFGGSNIEPSVRSCFELSKFPPLIMVDGFLNWLKLEPQSFVWLPVMHRLASSEFAKHQAKCNVCKMFPIIGLRYRCLRCFNFDICQNCFFSQRTSKNHKLNHPMQEYCIPTTSGDDIRDFGLILKNKLRAKYSKVGYLPVDTVDEGVPLEARRVMEQNPSTEPVHQRMQLLATRLNKFKREVELMSNGASPTKSVEFSEDRASQISMGSEHRRKKSGDLKSPSQLMSDVEKMHKEELDLLMQKLQFENEQLRKAVERKHQNQRIIGSTPNLDYHRYRSVPTHGPETYLSAENLPHRASITSGFSLPKPDLRLNPTSQTIRPVPSADEILDEERIQAEAKNLRLHQQRLEERSRILEEQNRQLQVQLNRLKQLAASRQSAGALNHDNQSGDKEFWSLPRGFSSVPPQELQPPLDDYPNGGFDSSDENERLDVEGGHENRMDSLMNTVNELGKAMETFVISVVSDEAENTINGREYNP